MFIFILINIYINQYNLHNLNNVTRVEPSINNICLFNHNRSTLRIDNNDSIIYI